MIVIMLGEWIASFTLLEFFVVGLGMLFSIGLFCSLVDDIITERRGKRAH